MADPDAFQLLGLPARLTIDEEQLRAAFLEAGRLAHPDAGGDEQTFARITKAHEILRDPARRLRHWLELHGIPANEHGPLPNHVVDLFQSVATAIQQAEQAIRRRESARTALAKALLEPDTLAARDAIRNAREAVDAAIQQELALFPAIEAAPDTAATLHLRTLSFLAKWRDQLRAKFASLA